MSIRDHGLYRHSEEVVMYKEGIYEAGNRLLANQGVRVMLCSYACSDK